MLEVALVFPLQLKTGRARHRIENDGVKAVVSRVEVLNCVAGDGNFRRGIGVAAEHFDREVFDIGISSSSEIGVGVRGDAHRYLLQPPIIVVAGNVIDADVRQGVGAFFKRQHRALWSRSGARIGRESHRPDIAIIRVLKPIRSLAFRAGADNAVYNFDQRTAVGRVRHNLPISRIIGHFNRVLERQSVVILAVAIPGPDDAIDRVHDGEFEHHPPGRFAGHPTAGIAKFPVIDELELVCS